MTPDAAIALVERLRTTIPNDYLPPSEGTRSRSHMILSVGIVNLLRQRGYLERVANQINGSYEQGWYDGCAVMMRRLLETLIIEVFEGFGVPERIQNANGDFLYLSDLVSAVVNQKEWNLGRNTKQALPRLKSLGDQSAHSRRFVAHREDVDKVQNDFRLVVQELAYLAKTKW